MKKRQITEKCSAKLPKNVDNGIKYGYNSNKEVV